MADFRFINGGSDNGNLQDVSNWQVYSTRQVFTAVFTDTENNTTTTTVVDNGNGTWSAGTGDTFQQFEGNWRINMEFIGGENIIGHYERGDGTTCDTSDMRDEGWVAADRLPSGDTVVSCLANITSGQIAVNYWYTSESFEMSGGWLSTLNDGGGFNLYAGVTLSGGYIYEATLNGGTITGGRVGVLTAGGTAYFSNVILPADEDVRLDVTYGHDAESHTGSLVVSGGDEAHPNLVLPAADKVANDAGNYGWDGNTISPTLDVAALQAAAAAAQLATDADAVTAVAASINNDVTLLGVDGTQDIAAIQAAAAATQLATDQAEVATHAGDIRQDVVILGTTGTLVISGGTNDPAKRNGRLIMRDGAGTAKAGVVVSYQLVHFDDETGDGFDDAILTVTTGEDGLATLPMLVGGTYRYWSGDSIRRTVAVTEDTTDPFELKSLVV